MDQGDLINVAQATLPDGATWEEKYRWAESRHLFWRSRCMVHAGQIVQLQNDISNLRELLKLFLEREHPRQLHDLAVAAIYKDKTE